MVLILLLIYSYDHITYLEWRNGMTMKKVLDWIIPPGPLTFSTSKMLNLMLSAWRWILRRVWHTAIYGNPFLICKISQFLWVQKRNPSVLLLEVDIVGAIVFLLVWTPPFLLLQSPTSQRLIVVVSLIVSSLNHLKSWRKTPVGHLRRVGVNMLQLFILGW